jgi:hypothetical protein
MTCEYRIPLEQKHYVSLLLVHDIDNNTELSFSLIGLAIPQICLIIRLEDECRSGRVYNFRHTNVSIA